MSFGLAEIEKILELLGRIADALEAGTQAFAGGAQTTNGKAAKNGG